jgi:predicted nucleic acid-binding Zn ribbon protein
MPLYLYECEHGHRSSDLCPYAERRASIECEVCGEPAGRHFTPPFIPPSGAYPYLSDALGVSADDVREAAADNARMGVPTQYTEDGSAIIESREHRKRLCEVTGMFDRDAGYGDATKTGRGLEILGNMEADGQLEGNLDFAAVEKERTDEPIYWQNEE